MRQHSPSFLRESYLIYSASNQQIAINLYPYVQVKSYCRLKIRKRACEPVKNTMIAKIIAIQSVHRVLDVSQGWTVITSGLSQTRRKTSKECSGTSAKRSNSKKKN